VFCTWGSDDERADLDATESDHAGIIDLQELDLSKACEGVFLQQTQRVADRAGNTCGVRRIRQGGQDISTSRVFREGILTSKRTSPAWIRPPRAAGPSGSSAVTLSAPEGAWGARVRPTPVWAMVSKA
jgi:hypothetical protein